MQRLTATTVVFAVVLLAVLCSATQSQSETSPLGMRASLHSRTLKTASKPPSGQSNRVDDLELIDNGDGTYTLAWSYFNVGDYNQDGIVNIQDITPLAAHFNESADASNEWIDGNGDTIINISDITPLAAGFFSQVAEYAVESSGDEGESWSEAMRVEFNAAIQEPAGTRKRFAVPLPEPAELNLYRVVPFDSSGTAFGPESNLVRFTAQPPTLKLSDETPADAGDGSYEAPYLVTVSTEYQLVVTIGEGSPVTTELSFQTFPPAMISISNESPFTLVVDNEMAGDFWVQALWREVAPVKSNRLYFRVEATLPP